MRVFRLLVPLALVSCAARSRPAAPTKSSRSESMSAFRGSAAQAVSVPAVPMAQPRKIIRDINMELEVSDPEMFLRALEALVGRTGGYVSDRQVQHSSGSVTSGTITVRVPVDRLDGANEELRAMGVVESESMTAQDISEQYADLEARLSSNHALEQRLLKMLDERAGQLSDVVAMESKLREVREDIEQLEGRQRLWDNQVALATIRIGFHARGSPAIVAEPGFRQTAVSTLRNSTAALVAFLRGLGLIIVALVPWIPLPLLAFFGIRWLRRPARQLTQRVDHT